MTDDKPGIAAYEVESDRIWVTAALGRTALVAASPGLMAALLAAFDAQAARRRMGVFAAWAQTIWPGAPAWAPASAFTLALVLGLGVGVALPSRAVAQDSGENSAFSLDAPASFDLVISDLAASDGSTGGKL